MNAVAARHDGGVSDDAGPPPADGDTRTDESGQAAEFPAERESRPKRRIDKGLLAISAVIAIGMVIVVRGILVGVTGDDRSDMPDLIESVSPVPEAVQVLSQSNVFVDLAAEHTGVLVIDGVEIDTVAVDDIGNISVEPGEQVDLPPVTIYEPGNATLTFTPSADAPIETFESGEHLAEVVYWRIDEGRNRARSYTWTFTVV